MPTGTKEPQLNAGSEGYKSQSFNSQGNVSSVQQIREQKPDAPDQKVDSDDDLDFKPNWSADIEPYLSQRFEKAFTNFEKNQDM